MFRAHADSQAAAVSIVDTRQYEYDGGRWRPVPGSGEPVACADCGRSVVVHARIGDGPIQGTACVKRITSVPASLERKARAEALVRGVLARRRAEGKATDSATVRRALLGRWAAIDPESKAIESAVWSLADRPAKPNPFVSQAQRRLFHAKAARGELSSGVVAQWERETVGPLPDRLHPPSVLVAPRAVRDAFRRGVELVRQGYGGKGLAEETVPWAKKLAEGKPITLAKAHDMHGWFARHGAAPPEARAREENGQSPAAVAWLLWGGDPSVPYGSRSRDPVFEWNRRVLAHFQTVKRNGRKAAKAAKGPGALGIFDLSATYKIIDESTLPPRWKTIGNGVDSDAAALRVAAAHGRGGVWIFDGLGGKRYVTAPKSNGRRKSVADMATLDLFARPASAPAPRALAPPPRDPLAALLEEFPPEEHSLMRATEMVQGQRHAKPGWFSLYRRDDPDRAAVAEMSRDLAARYLAALEATYAGRARYPNGMLVPVAGDEVSQARAGAFGMGAYVNGVVFAERKGALRVRILGVASMLALDTTATKTMKLDPSWRVDGDPAQIRRDIAEDVEVQRRVDEVRDRRQRRADRYAQSYDAALARGEVPLTLSVARPGMRIHAHHSSEVGMNGPIVEREEEIVRVDGDGVWTRRVWTDSEAREMGYDNAREAVEGLRGRVESAHLLRNTTIYTDSNSQAIYRQAQPDAWMPALYTAVVGPDRARKANGRRSRRMAS